MFELYNDLPMGVLKPVAERPEYRRSSRKQVDDRAWLRTAGGAARALLLDLSAEGALLETDLSLEPGTPVHLRCFLRDDDLGPFGIWARVARRDPADGDHVRLGVRFNYLRGPDRRRLQRYLDQRQVKRGWHSQFGF
jgi:c-di-GMP-binding flagellar brake protein YcgR